MVEFWIVTSTRNMTDPDLGDICFKTDVKNLMLQTMGGLKPEDILGSYIKEHEDYANLHAKEILEANRQIQEAGKKYGGA